MTATTLTMTAVRTEAGSRCRGAGAAEGCPPPKPLPAPRLRCALRNKPGTPPGGCLLPRTPAGCKRFQLSYTAGRRGKQGRSQLLRTWALHAHTHVRGYTRTCTHACTRAHVYTPSPCSGSRSTTHWLYLGLKVKEPQEATLSLHRILCDSTQHSRAAPTAWPRPWGHITYWNEVSRKRLWPSQRPGETERVPA